MNALPKDKVTGMLGVITALAGMFLLGAMVASADPMGISIGALIGASLFVGLVGTAFRGPVFDSSIRRGPRPRPVPESYPAGPTAVATLSAADTTAWTYDENDAEFAPVVSLTEAQFGRREERKRREAATAEA